MANMFLIATVLFSIVLHLEGKVPPDESIFKCDVAVNSPVASGKMGLTFVKEAHLPQFGIDLVGCRNWVDPNGMNCNAYTGDTLCTTLLPVLCVKIDSTPRPAYAVTGSATAVTNSLYAGWNQGHVASTTPVNGLQFANRAAVDAFCATSFGTGWRTAEFHDGYYIANMDGTTYAGDSWTQNSNLQQQGGWNFYSYGDLRNDMRFWVHISDQPSTCWAQ